MGSFSEQIKAWEQKALAVANKSVSNAVEELFTSIVVASPSPISDPQAKFSKGLLINQWYPSVGSASSEEGTSTNDHGIESLSRIKAMIAANPFMGKDNIVFLANNTEQAPHAEYLGWPKGEGTSGWKWTGTVIPYSMISKSVAKIRGMYM